jgi:hypothetical protein
LIARPSTLSSQRYSAPVRPSRCSRCSHDTSSSKEKALSRLIIRSRWSTAVNSVDTAPPTFCVGESGVRSSACASSSSSSRRIAVSNSASDIVGASST